MCDAGTGSRLTAFASRQHLLDRARCPSRTVFARAARFLDGEGAERSSRLQALRRRAGVDLVRLAAQADDQYAGEIRMARIARQRAAQDVHALAFGSHAAAGLVRERHHAVDVGIVAEAIRRESGRRSSRATVAEQFTLVRMPM